MTQNRIAPRHRKSLRWKLRALARDFAFRHEELCNALARIRRKTADIAIWVLCVGGIVGAAYGFLFLMGQIVLALEWW